MKIVQFNAKVNEPDPFCPVTILIRLLSALDSRKTSFGM